MKVKNVTTEQLTKALENVNKEQGYNLEFNRYPEKSGNFLNFTIKSKQSGVPGARVSHSGRNLISASWHAHGYLFDEILEIQPDAIIKTVGSTVDSNGGNWKDWNCGSQFSPCFMSETSIL